MASLRQLQFRRSDVLAAVCVPGTSITSRVYPLVSSNMAGKRTIKIGDLPFKTSIEFGDFPAMFDETRRYLKAKVSPHHNRKDPSAVASSSLAQASLGEAGGSPET